MSYRADQDKAVHDTAEREPTVPIGFRLPRSLLRRIEAIQRLDDDDNRNRVVVRLLEEAARERLGKAA